MKKRSKKKSNRLSDGRMPWEPKSETLQRRERNALRLLSDGDHTDDNPLRLSLLEDGLILRASTIYKHLFSEAKRIADRIGVPSSKRKGMHCFSFTLEPVSGGQAVAGLCFTRHDFTQCGLLSVDLDNKSETPEIVTEAVKSGAILPHMITMAKDLIAAGRITE